MFSEPNAFCTDCGQPCNAILGTDWDDNDQEGAATASSCCLAPVWVAPELPMVEERAKANCPSPGGYLPGDGSTEEIRSLADEILGEPRRLSVGDRLAILVNEMIDGRLEERAS